MTLRPRINMQGSYFLDCYESEVEVLKAKRELLRELRDMQVEVERRENDEARIQLELKNRKLHDLVLEKWHYEDTLKREKYTSASEEEQLKKVAALNSVNEQSSGITIEEY